jgi:cytochrome c
MKIRLIVFVIFCALLSCEKQKQRILVFSKTKGYRHESIEEGKVALIELGKKNGIEVDTTEDASLFNEQNLKNYNAVVFLSTTQNVLDPVQQADFKRFIEAGGGYVGIHAAADTEYEWPWYGKLVGAWFKSHPKQQNAKLTKVGDFENYKVMDTWERWDEWYNYKNISPDIKVIYNLDEKSYEGGQNGENHPISWYHEFEGGRSFYTGLGHTKESYKDSLFLSHVLDGIKYAIGNDKLDYDKVTSKRVPDENRFTKTVLDVNLYEPMELVVLPNLDILFIERHGEMKYYDKQTQKTEVIGKIRVSNKYNKDAKGNQREAEDGLLGLALDPKYPENHWIYMYYSPAGTESKNMLTRYTFADKKLDTTSMKVLLEIPVQRDQCCHTGGSITFDANGNLFVSTGDNTSPFESDGFSPSDERPGRSPFDAQKSSANTNDLRGKIIRIHPEPDGTYTIPEGNLFPKGEAKTRPEIYVMGNRNPYRISVDRKNGFLYWGEVGPDAGQDDSLRGSRGYDELNQARKAGNFGWPYFVGKNYNYAHYDFDKKEVGPRWNAEKPINRSPNNTGKEELPAVAPPFIWYPYTKSDEFPMVKEGGRNAMAGPFYYSEDYKGQEGAFPDYFDGKLMFYDWMRNWIFMATLTKEGDIKDIEPFMANTKFNNIIDMTYGPDGKLYMLEYGTGWFKQNLDARLVRIDYNAGNRAPTAMLAADKFYGAVPLTVAFTANGTSDPDGDEIKYELTADGKTQTSADGNFTVTFDKPGVFSPELKVTDKNGLSSTTKLQIVAGNSQPVVKAQFTAGNKTFFFPNTPVKYAVEVTDNEDGSSTNGKITANDVKITFDYLKGFDIAGIAQGHQKPSAELPGKGLIDRSDCKSCHLLDQRSAGPSFRDIALKYEKEEGAVDKLGAKVIKGGAGVWGETAMSAHPQVSVEDARTMVQYILTLSKEKQSKPMPLAGTATPGNEEDGAYLLTASYYDKGGNSLPSIPASETIVLRSPTLMADQANELRGPRVVRQGRNTGLENVRDNTWAAFKNIDLTGVKGAEVTAFLNDQTVGGEVEFHLDKPDGKLLGKAKLTGAGRASAKTKLTSADGMHDLYLVFRNDKAGDKNLFYFGSAKLLNK